jgi:hypothetical protein
VTTQLFGGVAEPLRMMFDFLPSALGNPVTDLAIDQVDNPNRRKPLAS